MAEEPTCSSSKGSAMAYKRNPIRAERLCGLSRRLLTDAMNGPLNMATQWLERSLYDSSNRRLVLPDALLGADAVLTLAAHLGGGLRVKPSVIRSRVDRDLPFMATETILMEAVVRGGDRQELHERIRVASLDAQAAVERGEPNPLIESIAGDSAFRASREEIESWLDPQAFTGRSAEQVEDFLGEVVDPLIAGADGVPDEAPRV
ncbi:MAG: adenylosuccinate lyase, partial [Acidobacteriota bacterium]